MKAAKALKEKGETPEELLRSIKENEKAVAEAEKEVDAWKAIAGEKSRREEAAKAEAERIATEKAEAERKAAEERERAEKEEKARIEAEKKEAERIAAEKAEEARVEAERKAEEERIAEEEQRAAEEKRIAEEKAEAERKAQEERERAEEERDRIEAELDAQKADEEARLEAERKADEEAVEKDAELKEDKKKPQIKDVVKTIYEKGKAVASKLFGRSFFDVAKTPDFMKKLGLTGDRFTIKYGVLSRHAGKDASHSLTEKQWEELPDAIQKPFAITRFGGKDNGYRLYTTMKNDKGETIVVGVDVKNAGRDMEVNAISTIFGRRNDAMKTQKEEVLYMDENITPEQRSLLGQPNSDQYTGTRERNVSIDKGSEKPGKKQEKQSVFDKAKEIADKEEKKRKAEADKPKQKPLTEAERKDAEEVAGALGYRVEWVDTMEENGTIDADKKVIRIAKDAENPLVQVLGHEVAHGVKRMDGGKFKALQKAAKEVVGEKEWNERIEKKRELNAYAEGKLTEEVTCDIVGEALNNKDALKRLAESLRGEKGILARLRNAVARMVEYFKNRGDKEGVRRMKTADKLLAEFESALKEGANERRLSPDTPIRLVNADADHGFKNYEEARAWAKENIARTYGNDETGGKGEIRISSTAIGKFLSEKAVGKSESKDVHLAVLRVLPDVIRESVDAEQHADYRKGADGKRGGNGVNPDVTMHILYGAVTIDGKTYRVKTTVKRDIRNEELASKAYSYEATKIELLAGTLGKPEDDAPSTSNSITAAKLLKGVKKSYSNEEFFANEGIDRSVRENRSEKTELTAEERELRDNLVERMRKGGLDVVTDSEEMQRVIDTENERTRDMFVGERGATAADIAEERTTRLDSLSVARQMEEAKKDAKTIKMATGWERGVDGKWRYETGDAKIKDTIEINGKTFKRNEEDMLWTGGKLGDAVDAPELFKAYPELKNVRIETDAVLNDMPSNGEYNPRTNTITIHSDDLKYQNSILNHEIQHAIQHIEGFEAGGSAENVRERIQQVIDNSSDEAGYARERLREWADLNAMAAMLDVAYRKFVGSGNEWERAKAVEIYWDAINTIEDNDKAELVINYPHDKTPREVAESGYLVDDVIRELNRLADETRKEIPDGNIDTMREVDRLVGALKDKTDFELYKSIAGEVEARNTEKRIGMTEEERRASLASETEDVAREDQILLGVDNAVGEVNTGSVREHRVYHGSGADFDAFDHSHMGEGEGAQAYGWGTYVTEVEGIGRTYAVQNSKYAREYPVYNGDSHGLSEGRVNEILEVFLDGVSNEPYILRAWDDAMQWYSSRKDDDYAQSLVRDASLLNPSDISIAGSKTRNLYTVEIPDDNGSNYLDWDAPLPKGTIPRINEYLREKYGEDETVSARTCKGLYHQLERILGGDKKASQALAELGYTGIKYPADYRRGGRKDGAKNYVIFNENDAKITAHTRFLRTAGGEVYGLVKDGRIYLDPKVATSETAVHEYTHLWGDMLRRKDSEQWSRTVKELKNSVLWEEVKELYPELKTDDEIADEVLSTFSGRRGAERLREEARRVADGEGGVFTKAKAIETLERVKEAIARFWEGVAKMFGINRYRSAEELADMAMKDLLDMKDESGMRKRGEVGETLATSGTYFSGGGLLEAGLKGVIDPKVAVEFSEKIAGVYADNHGNHIVVADVRDVDPKKLVGAVDGGEVQYFHASPVCKNFSKAKREGGEVELDKETALSTAEFIAKTRPKVVTIENVKGYRNSEALKIITDELTRQGYDWDADVYNAADYGGYTKRERLIVRAKRDGKLPPKPKKLPEELRKKGWYGAVEDLIPHLEEKKTGVPQGTDERLKNSGIDYRTIDKPLYVFGRGYANKTVGHAFADELLPTLTTGGGDIIIMPDGRVLKASPRVLARVTGLPDTYKMPETDQLSHTIVGNGIPTQLTEGVIAPLLDNAIPSAERATKRESVFDVADRVSQNLEERTRAMGSRVEKRMADVAQKLEGKELSMEQKAVVDVFSGKSDNQKFSVEREDGKKVSVVVRKGTETSAGTKHSLYRHYNTNVGTITTDDILLIPQIIKEGEIKRIRKGNEQYVEYTQKIGDKKLTTLMQIVNGKEVFNNFYSNKKGSELPASRNAESIDNTPEGAHNINSEPSAKVEYKSESPKLFGEEIIDDGKKGPDSIDRSVRENSKNEDKPRLSRKPGESIFDYASRVSEDVDRSVRERVSARDEYEKKVKSKGFQTKEALQNSMLGLQEFMFAIDHASGNKRYIEDIPDFENPILGENRLSSVNKEEMHQVAKTQFKPLMSAVAKLSGNGKESGELYDYMFAKHGLERDAVMRQREAQKEFDKYKKANPKGTKTIGDFVASLEGKDYAGLTAVRIQHMEFVIQTDETEFSSEIFLWRESQRHQNPNLGDADCESSADGDAEGIETTMELLRTGYYGQDNTDVLRRFLQSVQQPRKGMGYHSFQGFRCTF